MCNLLVRYLFIIPLIVICDEIMQRYATLRNDRPNKVHSDVTIETTQVSRDEEEIMEDAKNKLRLVLSNGSAPVFPVSGSHRMRFVF